ncbi:unnamed protein product [Haemonchus placei]|uniref:PABS domain-containing protein n=1 Tax=Haemonchus placei TaxID=6290 RepID=A0A0N4WIG5_HAEPC|nr:unnamed protein product [Haemonchus placei]
MVLSTPHFDARHAHCGRDYAKLMCALYFTGHGPPNPGAFLSLFQLDELCSELDQTCFIIADKVEEYNGKLMAFRSLRRKGPQGVLTLSDARILPPSPLTWENFNTKTWKIDKRTVRLEYARLMVVGAFFSGALEFNTTRKQDILLIGLGGGIINNYFTTLPNHTIAVTVVDIDPVMKRIAEKWYDFHESANHQIVIEDGVRFVRDAAKKGVKYDAILLDVCYNVPRSMMCPIDEFLSDDMLFCSAKEKNSWLDNRDELYNRYIAVDAALGFQLTLRKKFIPNDLL